MKRNKPRIIVTGAERGGYAAWLFTWLAIWLAGGSAFRVTPQTVDIPPFDGLVLGGGADIDPTYYGEERSPSLRQLKRWWHGIGIKLVDLVIFPFLWFIRILLSRRSVGVPDKARDSLELTLLEQAVAANVPVLGICRGEQLINVYFKGTLHQALHGFYTEYPEVRTLLPRKRVDLTPQTRLHEICGKDLLRVNALHRQGVAKLGEGLEVSARDKNGIIQAIEASGVTFVLGVQWHPEYMPQRAEQRAIFAAFVKEAAHQKEQV